MTQDSANKVIYSMSHVSKVHQGKTILKNITLSYFYGAKIGVLGLNGSGKSTLLKILAGVDTEFQGDISSASGYTIGYLEQEPLIDSDKTVMEVVREGVAETASLIDEFNQISEKFSEPLSDDEMSELIAKQGELQDIIDSRDAWDLDSRLEMAMQALHCPPPDAKVNILSGGEKRRVALCRLLLQEPDILLLDEPTNHLDALTVSWLEHHLSQYKGTIIAVTHDRYFLDNVAGWILELDRGKGIPWKGNYSSWLEQKQKRLQDEEKKELQLQQTLSNELDWIRMNPKGRQSKSKARLKTYETLLNQQSDRPIKDAEIYIPPGPRLGNLVVELTNVSKKYGVRTLVKDMTFALPAGGIVGVIGPNGAGKTTLFRMMTGAEPTSEGSIKLGDTVQLGYVDQSRDALPNDKTVWEVISDGQEVLQLGKREMNSRAYVSRFNFAGTDQQKKVGVLSGGERNRVHLARVIKAGANVLLLDEPTNDLDVNTIRALEDALDNFAGSAIIISHDRWFLDRVATHILAFEPDGVTYFMEGSCSDYEQYWKKNHSDSETRHRHSKLTR